MQQKYLDLTRTIMHLPTAPFNEQHIANEVQKIIQGSKRISLEKDRYGNMLLRYQGTKSQTSPQVIATAHMDHPALGYLEPLSPRRHLFEVLGGLPLAHLPGANFLVFRAQGPEDQTPSSGRVSRVHKPPRGRALAEITTPTKLPPLTTEDFALVDVPAWRVIGRRLYSRACDDLAGLCCGLLMMLELDRQKIKTNAGLLLTRAEEVGFGGMLAAVRSGFLPSDAVYINIECSSAKAGAPLGQGPIVRIGDRMSVFDPQTSAGLCAVADHLSQSMPDFKYQRKLMDGGACEATVLAHTGLATGAVALPLHNYHNNGAKGMAAEAIHLDDALGLVHLLVALSARNGGIEAARKLAKNKLEQHFNQRYKALVPRLR
jgi:putative aminopeptidase FrvX